MNTTFTRALLAMVLVAGVFVANAQISPRVQSIFPAGTVVHGNIPYAGDTTKAHLLDIYLPPNVKGNLPLVIWVHGGAWMLNDKYADMSYMKNTVKSFIDSGYAFASIDYRYSTDSVFPAQIKDCNQAIQYLYDHANEYKFDKKRFALIGFSAGGHLASLVAMSNNNNVPAFYQGGKKPSFKIKAVMDFYGPQDILVMVGGPVTGEPPNPNPLALLLGAQPFDRPDLAKAASPLAYLDKNDPPFIIIQGEKDQSVPFTQSVLLSSSLKLLGIPNELIIVPGAPHYGEMFDAEYIRKKIHAFLEEHLRN